MRNESYIRIRGVFAVAVGSILALLVPVLMLAQAPVPADKPETYPAWWFEQEVLSRTDTNQTNPVWPGDYPEQRDFGAVNQGQVKWMAKGGLVHLQGVFGQTNVPATILASPEWFALTNMVGSWESSGVGAADHAAANQGQVKEVARHFYDVFKRPDVLYYDPSISGWSFGQDYPWPAVTAGDSDYAAVNAGQLKNLFAFDLTDWEPAGGENPLDQDVPGGDGLLDAWEQTIVDADPNDAITDITQVLASDDGVSPSLYWDFDGDGYDNLTEQQQQSDPTDFYNGETPVIVVVAGYGNDQLLADGYFTPPLEVKITGSQGGPFQNGNVPVNFTVNGPGGLTLPGDGGAVPDGSVAPEQSLNVTTSRNGSNEDIATVYFSSATAGESIVTVSLDAPGAVDETVTLRAWQDQGLLAHWALDETSGALAADSSGFGRDAAVLGDPTRTAGWGESLAVNFDGVDDYLILSGTEDDGLDFTNQSFTISFWIRTVAMEDARVVGTGFDSWSNGYFAGLNASGQVVAGIGGGADVSSAMISSVERINNGLWHHVAVVFPTASSSDLARIYINGEPKTLVKADANTGGTLADSDMGLDVSALANLVTASSQPFTIGAYDDDSNPVTAYFDGTVDQIKVFGRVLDHAQVRAKFESWVPDYSGDVDRDGLPDVWEETHFAQDGRDPLRYGASDDPDGDGVSNVSEYTVQTNPWDYFNGAAAYAVIVKGGGQRAAAGEFLPQPLEIYIHDSQGNAVEGLSVVYNAISDPQGALATFPLPESEESQVISITSILGRAHAFYRLSSALSSQEEVVATIDMNGTLHDVLFQMSADADGFSPPMSGLQLWLDSARGVGFYNDGVASWADTSGTQIPSLGVHNPYWVREAIGGRPAVRFDGQTDFVSLTDPSGLDAEEGTIAIVARRTGASSDDADGGLFSLGDPETGMGYALTMENQTPEAFRLVFEVAGEESSRIATTAIDNQFHLVVVNYEPGQSRLALNGASFLVASHTAVPTEDPNSFTLGRAYSSDQVNDIENLFLRGEIAEVLVYDRTLNEREQFELEDYLAVKYQFDGVEGRGVYAKDQDLDGLPDDWEASIYGALPGDGIDSIEHVHPEQDFDSDGKTNLEEYRAGTAAWDPFDGTTPALDMVGGNLQSAQPGVEFAEPLVVRVTNGLGVPVPSVEVAFTVSQGSSQLSEQISGQPILASALNVQTDAQGLARVYLQAAEEIETATIDVTLDGVTPLQFEAEVNTQLALPWQSVDVGATGLAGQASGSADHFLVRGAGLSWEGTADAFHYVYQTLDGDGELIAKVESFAATTPTARAGLIWREALTPGSASLAVSVGQNGDLEVLVRSVADSVPLKYTAASVAAPVWLKLRREGNQFAALYSPDGATWTEIHQVTLGLNTVLQVGLAVSSANVSDRATAMFDRVRLIEGDPNAVGITGGESHSLLLRDDGVVMAWGANYEGQLGLADNNARKYPTPVGGLGSVAQISAGSHFSAAALTNGNVYTWGRNSQGQLGDGNVDSNGTPVSQNAPVTIARPTGAAQDLSLDRIAAGTYQVVGLDANQDLWGWGFTDFNQLGEHNLQLQNVPIAVHPAFTAGKSISKLASGDVHVIALESASGRVWAWGNNSEGQLAVSTTSFSEATPQEMRYNDGTAGGAIVTDAIEVAAGGFFTLCLRSDGTVWAAGSNSEGQLGSNRTIWHLERALLLEQVVYADGSGGFLPLDDCVAIAAGKLHAIALREDGSVWAWGRNNLGQLGTGDTLTAASAVAVPVVGLTGITRIAAGDDHSLAVDSEGFVYAWGSNFWGQLGAETEAYVATPVLVRSAFVYAALDTDGDGLPDEWEWNQFGSLTAEEDSEVDSDADGLDLWEEYVQGTDPDDYFNGEIPELRLLRGFEPENVVAEVAGPLVVDVRNASGEALQSAPVKVSIKSGAGGVSALLGDGTPPGAGDNFASSIQIATDEAGQAEVYFLAPPLPGESVIEIQSGTALPLTVAVSYGLTRAEAPSVDPPGGALGTRRGVTLTSATPGVLIHYTTNGEEPDQLSPFVNSGQSVSIDSSVVLKARAYAEGFAVSATTVAEYEITGALAAGAKHSLLLRDDGTVFSWGRNAEGQLGRSGTAPEVPHLIPGLSDVVAIRAGHASSSGAVTAQAGAYEAYLWGNGASIPAALSAAPWNLSNIRSLAIGEVHFLALQADGSTWSWGGNASGQIGDSTTIDRTVPFELAFADPEFVPVEVAAGKDFSFAQAANGSIMAWGENSSGQLALGNVIDQPAPVAIADLRLADAPSIWGGDGFSIVNPLSGSHESSGDNASGQLGDGTQTSRNVLSEVDGLGVDSPVKTVAVGRAHALALQENGTVLAWGANDSGQLGDGTLSMRTAPVVVVGPDGSGELAEIIAIAAGADHSLAIRADGSVWAWGSNTDQQLGNDQATNRIVPALVRGVSAHSGADTDSDGLNDSWELQYFGDLTQGGDADSDGDGRNHFSEFEQGSDPTDFFNGFDADLQIIGGNNQSGAPNEFLDQTPLQVRVRNSDGVVADGQGVTFAVSASEGELAASNTGTTQFASSFTVATDSNGEASVYLRLHSQPNRTTTVTASAGSALSTVSVLFTATSDQPNNYYQGQVPQVALVSGHPQGGPAGRVMPVPLVVEVRSPVPDSDLLEAAPVTFTIVSGSGSLAEMESLDTPPAVQQGDPPVTEWVVYTGETGGTIPVGQTGVYFIAPDSPGTTVIEAVAGTAAPVRFEIHTLEKGLFPREGLQLWLQAATGVALDPNNRVEACPDLSGWGNSAAQSDADKRPAVIQKTLGGDSVGAFQLTGDDFLTINEIDDAVTVIMVYQPTGPPGAGQAILGHATQPYAADSSHLFSPSTAATEVIEGELRLDGLEVDVASAVQPTGVTLLSLVQTGPVSVDSLSSGLAGTLQADVLEVLVYNRPLEREELQRLQSYLNDKFEFFADSDGDGLPDAVDPEINDFYNGVLPVMHIVDGNLQRGPAGVPLPQSLVVEVTDALGNPLAFAPLDASMVEGGGAVSETIGGSFGPVLALRTNSSGQASFYLRPEGADGTRQLVDVTATTGALTSSVVFTATTGIPPVAGIPNPGGGGNGFATNPSLDRMPPDYDLVLIVRESASGVHPSLGWSLIGNATYQVQRRRLNGTWQTIATLDDGDTTYEDSNVRLGRRYVYRVLAYGGSAIIAESNLGAYKVPLSYTTTVYQAFANDFKPGFSEFSGNFPPSDPPKRYLTASTVNARSSSSSGVIDPWETRYQSRSNGHYNFTSSIRVTPDDSIGALTTETLGSGVSSSSSSYTESFTLSLPVDTDDDGEPDDFRTAQGNGEYTTNASASTTNPSDPEWRGVSSGSISYHETLGGTVIESYSDSWSDPINGPPYRHPGVTQWDSEGRTFRFWSDSDGNSSSTVTNSLSNEYTTGRFVSDVIRALPDYTEDNFHPHHASRYLSSTENYFSIEAARIELETEEGYLGETQRFYVIFVPYNDPDTDKDESEEIEVLETHEWTGGPSKTIHVDHSLNSNKNGYYNLVRAADLAGFDTTGVALDEEEESEVGIVIEEGKNGYGLYMSPILYDGFEYKLSWGSNRFKVYYTDSDGRQKRLGNGERLDAEEFAEISSTLIIEVDPSTPDGLSTTFSMTGYDGTGSSFKVDSVNAEYVKKNTPSVAYSVPLQEASGPRYRKIGLNGMPLADSKPQAEAESDEEPEETYIDALTLGLRHSTTDVYVPVPGSPDLALVVRRNTTPDVWNLRSGLRMHEQPNRPFGAGWTSNLSANIQFVSHKGDWKDRRHNPDRAIVTDENGSTYIFLIWYYGTNGKMQFFPMPSQRTQQNTYLCSLIEDSSGNFVFTRKYGTKLIYQDAGIFQNLAPDRIQGPDSPLDEVRYTYARLTSITDRLGHRLNYEYEGARNLVPKTISVEGRPELALHIRQDDSARVQSIWDPEGNETRYQYLLEAYPGPVPSPPESGGQIAVLRSVERPDGGEVRYGYNVAFEEDPLLADKEARTPHYHCDVNLIEDSLGNRFTFQYGFDRSRKVYRYDKANQLDGHYVIGGLPRNIQMVRLPGTIGWSRFENQSDVSITGSLSNPRMVGVRKTRVTDAEGNVYTYDWGNAHVEIIDTIKNSYASPNRVNETRVIYYQTMTLTYGDFPSNREVFEFDLDAGLALTGVSDFSGNKTKFLYEDDWESSSYRKVLSAAKSINRRYDDCTSQINAFGEMNGTKSFTYGGPFRIMDSITDEEGRKTRYQLDGKGRRTVETLSDADETVLQVTEYAYEYPEFPGFLSRKTITTDGAPSVSDPQWVKPLTVEYVPDRLGRVAREIIDPNGERLVTSYEYDLNGNRTKVTNARGHSTVFRYDERNRLVEVGYPNGAIRSIAYDTRGNKLKEIDENGHAMLWEYDVLNRMVRSARDMNANGIIDSGADLVTEVSYNNVNSKTGLLDPRGHQTTYVYDSLQRLKSTIAPFNTVTDFFYGENSGGSVFDVSAFKPTATVDPRGYVTKVAYDALYRPTSTRAYYEIPTPDRDPDAVVGDVAQVETRYDHVGNATDVLTHRAGSGDDDTVTTTTVYDGLNRPVRVTAAVGGSVTEELVSTTAYTSTGLAWQAVFGVGRPDARTTQTEYDAAGRAVKVIQPLVRDEPSGQDRTPVVTTSYDDNGNVISTTNPLGHVWTTTYDARNRKIQEFLPPMEDASDGSISKVPVVTIAYDALGNVVRVTDARGHVTTTDYDPANRPFRVTAPPVYNPDTQADDSPVTETLYDNNGNVTDVIDARGLVTKNTYDALNRLVTTTQDYGTGRLNLTVTNEYDPAGNLVRVTDGLGQKTAYTHDGLGRVLTQTYGEGTANDTTTFTYDAANQRTRLDPNGVTTSYAYDLRSRLTAVTYSPGGPFDSNRSYAYDAYGNLLGVTEPGKIFAADVAYQYDALDRVTAETSAGQTHTYGYDLAGNRTAVTYGGTGREVVNTYDPHNRLLTMTESGRTTNYGYDLAGNRIDKVLPNGDLVRLSYDALNRPGNMVTYLGGKDPQTQAGLQGTLTCVTTYDLLGNVRGLTEASQNLPGGSVTLADRTVVNVYDGANRLQLEAIDTGSDGTVDRRTEYGYDAAHNRTARTVTTDPGGTPAVTATGYAYPGQVNQLAFIYADANANGAFDPGEAKTAEFTYDANGNRLTRSAGGQTDLYTWDSENRLVNLEQFTTDRGQAPGEYLYGYDYRSRRVLRDEALAGKFTAQVVFSGGTSAWEHYYPQPGTPTVEYVRGSDYGGGVGGILYTLRPDGQGGVTPGYTHSNHRGDVIAKTDAAGLLTWQSQYEAFGTRPDEAENPAAPNLDRQKANSKDEDPTGLLNEGFRYRDLETGTFISRDPLGLVDGPNIYTYVRQNPWTMFDPKGLQGFAASMNQGYNPTEAQKQNQQILFNAATSPKVWEGVGLGVAGFIPYVGDALDVNDVVHPGSTGFDRTMGSLSLTANAFTAGLAPNAGPIQRGGRKIWSGLQEAYQAGMRSADDAVGVVSDSAQLTLRTRPNAEVQRMLDAGELNISPQAEALLRNLKGSGSSMEVGSDFSLSTLADLQRATQVEFGLFNVGNKNMLVRGRAFEVDVPTDATGVIAHSHNGTNIFSVRPSGADIGVLQRFNQSSSKIVNEAGIATEFTVDRKLLSLWDTTE